MLHTHHRLAIASSPDDAGVAPDSVHLVVTSPPYPMVEMWDAPLSEQHPAVADALAREDGPAAFEAMHRILDPIWAACHRALVPGGLMCVNIGDATRKVGGDFQLCSNHARVIQGLLACGFQLLPDILWRKPTNAPNKFMGSGMLPAGAYVTYEHEYILIARKGGRRLFRTEADRARRRRSAFFWEERNQWFSDVWQGLTGIRQHLQAETRKRSAAYPVELPARLIDMYSLQEDVVMDPFSGTGTTALAAAAAGRSSVSIEREATLRPVFEDTLSRTPTVSAERARQRLKAHEHFLVDRRTRGKAPKHRSAHYGFGVVTRQEVAMQLPVAQSIAPRSPDQWDVSVLPGARPAGWEPTPD